jgi:hypothetical protein
MTPGGLTLSPRLKPRENDEWVAQYGKHDAYDVTDEPPYSRLIGATIEGVDVERDMYEGLVGLRLRT